MTRTAAAGAPHRRPMTEQISWIVVALTTLVLPLVVSAAAKDSFRVPKDLLLKASGIILLALTICEVILEGRLGRKRDWPRSLLFVLASVFAWCSVVTITSTNRPLSIMSLMTVAAALVFFAIAYRTVRGRSLAILYVMLVPAVVNAVIAIAQRTKIWTPLTLDDSYSGRMATTALMGNPDDIGMFLFAPALAAVALAISSKRHRWPATIIAIILGAGVVASETVGSMIPIAAGLLLILFRVRPRTAIVTALLCGVLATAAVRLSPSRWSIAKHSLVTAMHGDIDPLLSGRLPAFLAALRMFRHHPLFGVGPGCFPFQYFDEKIAIEMEHPWLLNRNVANFGETHSEHLQILAEGGLPAYAIFVGALIALALISFRPSGADDSETMKYARLIALPLAAGFFILALSSFPLHLAAATTNTLFLCAVTLAWSTDARA